MTDTYRGMPFINIDKLEHAMYDVNLNTNCNIRARHKYYILKRDNFKCVSCGSTEHLTIDHIKKKRSLKNRNAQAYSPKYNTCKTLCVDCHLLKNHIIRNAMVVVNKSKVNKNERRK